MRCCLNQRQNKATIFASKARMWGGGPISGRCGEGVEAQVVRDIRLVNSGDPAPLHIGFRGAAGQAIGKPTSDIRTETSQTCSKAAKHAWEGGCERGRSQTTGAPSRIPRTLRHRGERTPVQAQHSWKDDNGGGIDLIAQKCTNAGVRSSSETTTQVPPKHDRKRRQPRRVDQIGNDGDHGGGARRMVPRAR